MKYKTKEIVVEVEDLGDELFSVFFPDIRCETFTKSIFDLLFEPLEENKQETFKCKKCHNEYVQEIGIQYKNWFFCENCFNKIKNIKVTLRGENEL